ncbi:hypothetical protein Tco_1187146 [Tanacetum coccineum]
MSQSTVCFESLKKEVEYVNNEQKLVTENSPLTTYDKKVLSLQRNKTELELLGIINKSFRILGPILANDAVELPTVAYSVGCPTILLTREVEPAGLWKPGRAAQEKNVY